jgi:hypothetical protein
MTDLTKLDWSKCELPKLPEQGCGYFSGMQIEVEAFDEDELALQVSGIELYWLGWGGKRWQIDSGRMHSYIGNPLR